MTVHIHWPSPSVISSLRSERAKEGNKNTVYLFANPFAIAGHLSQVINDLQEAGYHDIYPDIQQGKACLAIRKVDNATDIARLLEQHGWAEGTQQRADARSDKEVQAITPSYIRQHAVIGNAASAGIAVGLRAINAAVQRHYLYLFGAGLNWMQQAILLKYGTGTGATPYELLSDARNYLKQQAIDLPDIDPQEQQSLIQKIERYIARNSIQTAYTIGIPMGGAFALNGFHTKNLWQMISGSLVILGASVIAFVPERRKNPDEQEESIQKDIMGDIKAIPGALKQAISNPLGIPNQFYQAAHESPKRMGAMVAYPNALLAILTTRRQGHNVKSWAEENPAKIKALTEEIKALEQLPSSHIRRTLYLGTLNSNLQKLDQQFKIASGAGKHLLPGALYTASALSFLAFTLLAISSKNRLSQQMDMTNFDKLYSMAAQSLLTIPEEERQRVFENTTGYLADQQDLKDGFISIDTLRTEISTRMEAFKHTPWIGHISLPQKQIAATVSR